MPPATEATGAPADPGRVEQQGVMPTGRARAETLMATASRVLGPATARGVVGTVP